MADRRAQVIQLLATRYDGLYLPPGSLTTRAGLVPAEREPCTHCGGILVRDDYGKVIRRCRGRGYIYDAFKRRQPCTHCGEVGEIARDPMDAQHVRIGSTATVATARPRRTVPCDACDQGVRHGKACSYCHGTGRRDLHVFDLTLDTRDVDERDPMLTAIEQRNHAGSYRELELALAGIRVHINKGARYELLTVNASRALRLLDELFVPPPACTLDALDDSERVLVDLAVGYIVDRMPDPIRVPAQVVANAREHRDHRQRVKGRQRSNGAVRQRDNEIRGLVRRGVPSQRVAFDYGLSVSQVNRIVHNESEVA